MALKSFERVAAGSLENAVACVDPENAAFVAGGTDLLGVLKERIHSDYPRTIVSLKKVAGLDFIKEDKRGLRIGAMATLSDIANYPAVKERYPALAQAARSVASPQIRNTGTIGGNICQEPRCWYYRSPDDRFHCIRKGGNKCPALLGDNRYHSIFGGANTSQPSCAATCPSGVQTGRYLHHIRKNEIAEAAKILLENNPIPALTGRVCPHTCEAQCNRGDFDEPVSIREVERFVGDYILGHAGEFFGAPKSRAKKSVAIVGSGPAGLAAAFYLRRSGYEVEVFERFPEPGGMLTYSIPAYRLSKNLVREQIDAFKRMGIKFQCGVEIKKSDLSRLRRKFDAVLLATGTWRQKTVSMAKAELLTSGMDFLTDVLTGKQGPLEGRVLVIGGGNVAVDVAITAKRLGAKQVTMACLEGRDALPAFSEEIEQALEEGVKLLPSWGPWKVVVNDDTIGGMELIRCTSVFDEQGRFHPSFDSAQKQVIDAEHVILAIGQSSDLGYLDKSVKTERGLILVDERTFATSAGGVFAAGDVASGPSSVVHAIGSGRKAAMAIDASFGGRQKQLANKIHAYVSELLEMHSGCSVKSVRGKPEARPLAHRFIDAEDRQTLAEKSATSEAHRCVNCSCVAVNASDIAPVLVALNARIKTTRRTVKANAFFGAVERKCTVLKAGELVKEIEIPAPSARTKQQYLKFRIRNSIDFPIVGLAAVFDEKNGAISDARFVLGAVAPVPLELPTVEEFLEGKTANEETATVAGALAVRAAQPLSKNGFKLPVVKALIKKAIMGH